MTSPTEEESPHPSDNGELQVRQEVRGGRPGDRYVRISHHPDFKRVERGVLLPREDVGEPTEGAGRVVSRLQRFIFGRPIPSASELLERVGIGRGLAIFASDNISSSAYASEEIMRALIFAGLAAMSLTMPITVTILVLLAIVIISDFQVVRAYPNGGGSYVVAKENLGVIPGLIAAAALLTDYILTAAVSISAGVTAIISAFPDISVYRVPIALVVLVLITIVNLRGIRESGQLFALPVYTYVVAILGLVAIGIYQTVTNTMPTYVPPPEWLEAEAAAAHPLTLFLVLRAFASGAVALTGVEAISNGVPAFQPPEVRNARITLVIMGCLFGTIFFSVSSLATHLGIVPDPHEIDTVISQIARTLVGEGWYYYVLQFATAILLMLAANTAFNGLPRLASVLAQDQFLPRQFSFRGDRLAFTGGIILLTSIAAILIVVYKASVTGLIPLYTVGVFVAFTLSQAGLVRRWWTQRGNSWQLRLAINSVGVAATGTVAVVVAVSKFMLGAWMVLVLIPIMVWLMWSIRRHYLRLNRSSAPETPLDPAKVHVRVVVPVANTAMPTRQALAYALALAPADRVVAVHVANDEEEADRFKAEWQEIEHRVPLVVIESPYRSLLSPLLAYIEAMQDTHPEDTMTVVLPEYVPSHWWEHLLHNQTALRLKGALLFHPGIVVTSIPYHIAS